MVVVVFFFFFRKLVLWEEKQEECQREGQGPRYHGQDQMFSVPQVSENVTDVF